MSRKLKRDELPQKQAQNWRMNFSEEQKLTFNLQMPQIILQKDTYKILNGEEENRVRIYLGLESEQSEGRYVLCAFAVSSFLMGSGDVYADYETPVFKLSKINENYSSKTNEVIDSLRRYRKWRLGELDGENELASFRKYIYPNAYLLTKSEVNEIFNAQNKQEAQIEFGISKTMNAMIYPEVNEHRSNDDTFEVFSSSGLCPPNCDERSIYSS